MSRASELNKMLNETSRQFTIIKTPNGRFKFVGSVPRELVILDKDNKPVDDEIWKKYTQSNNPAMTKKIHKLHEPIFDTREEAVAFAKKHGHSVK